MKTGMPTLKLFIWDIVEHMLRDQVQIEQAKGKSILTIVVTLSTYIELLRCENIL